ncbi:hypothetical protein [Actinomycetospora aeridis]|uniref:YD repeat-containing protein n=1 Tax=Actinomycetospora aeridis TaxID=3129231 RepID=A0ABU8ND82_9PSEU
MPGPGSSSSRTGAAPESSGEAGEDPDTTPGDLIRPDGSAVLADGSIVTMRDGPNGGLVQVTVAPDGTRTTVDYGADGMGLRTTVVHPDGTATREYHEADGRSSTVRVVVNDYGDVVEIPNPGNYGHAGSADNAGDARNEGHAGSPPEPKPVEENVLLHHGNLQIFRYHDGRVMLFASWENDPEVFHETFPPGADWKNAVIHATEPVQVYDGVGTYHYEQQVTYGDGRIRTHEFGGVEPIWNDWF